MEEKEQPEIAKKEILPEGNIENQSIVDYSSFFSKIEAELHEYSNVLRAYVELIKNKIIHDNEIADSKKRKTFLFYTQIVSLFTTLLALCFTYFAVQKAGEANAISKASLEHIKYQDSQNNIKNINEKIEQRLKDSFSNNAIRESLEIAKKNAEASSNLVKQSIKSLEDVQNRFEKENQPFLRIIPQVNLEKDSFLIFSYRLTNYGKLPAYRNITFKNLYYINYRVQENDKMIIDSIHKQLNQAKYIEKQDGAIITNDTNDKEIIENIFDINKLNWTNDLFLRQFFYFYGRIYYSPAQSINQTYYYDFIIQMTVTKTEGRIPINFTYKYVYSFNSYSYK